MEAFHAIQAIEEAFIVVLHKSRKLSPCMPSFQPNLQSIFPVVNDLLMVLHFLNRKLVNAEF